MNNPLITQFYEQKYSWRVPWNDIRIQQGGTWLSILRLIDKRVNGCTWAREKPYVIQITAEHWQDLVLLCHEVAHVWQREKVGPWFWARYLAAGTGDGNRYEREAREIEQEFMLFMDSRR